VASGSERRSSVSRIPISEWGKVRRARTDEQPEKKVEPGWDRATRSGKWGLGGPKPRGAQSHLKKGGALKGEKARVGGPKANARQEKIHRTERRKWSAVAEK